MADVSVNLEQRQVARKAAQQVKRRQHRHDTIVQVVAVVVVLAGWEVVGRLLDPLLFAPPSAVVRAAVEVIASGELWRYLSVSLKVFAIGMIVGTLVGIPLGIAMARFRYLDLSLEPFVIALYSTPMVALIPLLVIWMGFGDRAKATVIFLFALFPILLNTYQGVRSVEPKLLEVARSFRSSERALWMDTILPSSLPFIVAGIRLALGRALVGMVVADLYTAVSGVGYLIARYAQTMQTDRLLVPVVTLSILGVTLVQGLRWLEHRLAPWQHYDRED